MTKRIEEKFFKGVYDIIEYWAKQEKDNLTGEKFTDKDKIEGAFHSFFTMIEGCSSINDFNYYTIHNKYGKELPNINGYYMYVCFRKFRGQLTHRYEDIEDEVDWDTNVENTDDPETNSMNELFNYNED